MEALQVLLCYSGLPFLPEPSLLRKKDFFLLFFISPEHNSLLPSNKANAQLNISYHHCLNPKSWGVICVLGFWGDHMVATKSHHMSISAIQSGGKRQRNRETW